ncbi:MAG TPA: TatD family hydrolase [Candidatus Cloacimonadota bacterium]|nr:TatD family hydrolase [Candidatus Cloacimonadota bacterium]
MNNYLHDTHIHLDLYDNWETIVEEIERNHIYSLAVTNLPVLYEKSVQRVKSKFIKLALGFHPELVHKYKHFIPTMWKLINNTDFIGEVGLNLQDVSQENKTIQIDFLSELISRCELQGGKILSIHSKNSETEILSIIPQKKVCTYILHWYSGSIYNLGLAIASGCYFSVNYAMMSSKKGIHIIEKIPLNRLLLESDGPFVLINNKLFQPKDINLIASKLSLILKIDIEEVRQNLSDNFNMIFKKSY